MASVETVRGGVLDAVPLVAAVPPEVRSLLEAAFVPQRFAFGEVIVREGDDADAFFVLVSGTARAVKTGDRGEEVALNTIAAGESFGERGLIQSGPRTATVRASTEVEVLRLDRSVFRALIASNPDVAERLERQIRRHEVSDFLRLQSVFARLPPVGLETLVAELEELEFRAGEILMREGDPPGSMYVVREGRLRARQLIDGVLQDVGYIRAGDLVGEIALLRGSTRTATVEAVSDCVLLELSNEAFTHLRETYEEFEAAVEERVAQYDYRARAHVPLDFAEELLPADVIRIEPVPAAALAGDGTLAVEAQTLDEVEEAFAKPARRIRSFPMVWQVDEADCGAAAVAMVCRYFGREVSLARVRQAVFATADGTSLVGVAHGARTLGLQARTLKASKSRLDELPLPAIVHWEGNHWIVLYDVDAEHVRVADPGRGRRRIPRAEFLEKWSGYAACLAATDALAETPEAPSSVRWLGSFLRPHRLTLSGALTLAFVAAGLQMLLPIFSDVIVNHVLPHHDYGLLTLVTLGIFASLVLAVGASVVQRYVIAKASFELDTALLDFLTGKLLALPLGYFALRRTGDIERRLGGMYQIRQLVIQDGVYALSAMAQLLVAIALMFVFSWELALVYLATAPLYLILMRVSARYIRPLFDSLEEAWGKYRSRQIDAIRGIETVKALSAEQELRRAMLANFTDLARWMFRADFAVMSYQAAVQLVSMLSLGLFLWIGALQVLHHNLSIGGFVSFNLLVMLANTPILIVLALWDRVQYASILLDRLGDVLESEPEQGHDHEQLRAVETLEGRVRFVRMSFSFPGPNPVPIVQDIDLEVAPGMSIAIVGRSGCGKTTLIKCLAGLLEPTEGTILYDGIDLRTLDYSLLRRRIGFVLQDNYIFADTIAANIALGDNPPDADRVIWASKLANAHEFITRLPLGYNTQVGESGLRLSGGQAQRIAIARAVYPRPPILIFDEATSALDTESERIVQQNLAQLLDGHTSFVIAHRLSTVRNADLILVLDKGRIVEQGTHDDLLAREGLYFYLISQQLQL
jgi:ATP-binding cassette subfamily B protein